MVERAVSRTQELRQKFEEKYRKYFPDFKEVFFRRHDWSRNGRFNKAYRQWLEEGTEPEDPALLAEFQALQSWKSARMRMEDLLKSDPQTFNIVLRLIVPLSCRLDVMAVYEFNNPPKPATKKETLRAIRSVEKEIDRELLPLMWKGISDPEEDWGEFSVNRERLAQLEQHKAELEK